MRILVFVLLSSLFVMCKSKNIVPSDELIEFVVILEQDSTPKAIKKDISFELANFEKKEDKLNRWSLNYNEDLKKEKKIKTALLNHPSVVSVFSKEQYEMLLLKKGGKSGEGSSGRRKEAKQ